MHVTTCKLHPMGFTVSFQQATKKFIAVVEELNLKKKMSPGPVAAMAAHSPGSGRHLQRQSKDVPYK
jgi:hypothetical protein